VSVGSEERLLFTLNQAAQSLAISKYIATNFLGHGTVNPKANESDD
jgi:hypothetical protein